MKETCSVPHGGFLDITHNCAYNLLQTQINYHMILSYFLMLPFLKNKIYKYQELEKNALT